MTAMGGLTPEEIAEFRERGFITLDSEAGWPWAATPWHQDEAHRTDPGTDYEQISIWMPLQEATVANGCMEFIPGTHRGPVLPHRSPGNGPRVTALECIGEFDPARAERCPLKAGGATVHYCRTLHGAGPNLSDIPR